MTFEAGDQRTLSGLHRLRHHVEPRERGPLRAHRPEGSDEGPDPGPVPYQGREGRDPSPVLGGPDPGAGGTRGPRTRSEGTPIDRVIGPRAGWRWRAQSVAEVRYDGRARARPGTRGSSAGRRRVPTPSALPSLSVAVPCFRTSGNALPVWRSVRSTSCRSS